MFKKSITFTALCTALVSFSWIFKLVYPSSSEVKQYHALKSTGKPIVETKSQQETRQQRSGVRKDLWLSQPDKTRLHYRIASKSSVLTLIPIDDKLDIIENLQQLQCWMQDKLYTQGSSPMQQMRFFVADHGIYQYSSQRFAANSVALSLFRLPGTELPLALDAHAAFLRGIAQDVSFSIAGKFPQFHAQHFKATLLAQPEDKR